MKKIQVLTLTACSMLALSSCSNKMVLTADNFEVVPNPLETQTGMVPSTINGSFPEKFMKKKAVVTVIPELRYAGQATQGQSATFQGEKVLGNNQTISYRLGGRYTMRSTVPYNEDMQKSELWMTFKAYKGKKEIQIPAVKVADGVIATSELYKKTLLSDGGCQAVDSFQRVKAQKQEANIKFLVSQANLRKSELKNNSVTEFVEMLKKINADREGFNLSNVEVQAYASPEGGFKFNDKLAGKRQNVSEKYVKDQLKKTKMNANIDAHYTAQDWDGFQRLVQASNLQDKDVILRVLSMYKDPEEREQQIRNMSAAFRELADGILPELRRSRLIINYETIGRSDDQIKEQYNADAAKLSADELLYFASLQDTQADQEKVYKKTAELYDKDYRAYNNLATIALSKCDKAAAASYLAKALALDANSAESNANKGLMSLATGNMAEAEAAIAKGATSETTAYAQGVLSLAKGNYAQAQQLFGDKKTNSAALAQLLAKDYDAASKTLDKVENADAITDYLHAIVAARRGNKFAAASYLKEALKKDPSLKAYADNDLELAITK